MNWKYSREDLVSGDFKIRANYYFGSRSKALKDYSLYKGSELIFTGSLIDCKSEAIKESF